MLQADKYSASPGEGHLAEPIADVQPPRRKPLFMPEAVGKRVRGVGRRAVFSGREGRRR